MGTTSPIRIFALGRRCSRSLEVIPSTSSHVMQSLISTQRPVTPCSASFCSDFYEETYQTISRFLAIDSFTLPPISTTTLLQHICASLVMLISLPTGPLSKLHRHQSFSVESAAAVCPPAFLIRHHSVILIRSVRSLYVYHYHLIRESSLFTPHHSAMTQSKPT